MTIDLKAIRERLIQSDADSESCPCTPQAGESCELCEPIGRDEARALFDLVDAMTGALLGSERAAECGGCLECCPACRMCLIVTVADDGEHAEGCPLDAALTLTGFPDFASRDAERARRARP